MPHVQRKRGESGFYHIVAKGDGAQILFESNKDRERYIDELALAMQEHDLKLHAYCLMNNHVHLLAQDERNCLSQCMKQLGERYAMYFKDVTGRVGRVFQRPFWSEPVETDAHFLSALRYIHANPEPAGICKASDYPWSSYQAYISSSSFVETEFAHDLLGGVQQFERFSATGGSYAKPFKTSKLTQHHDSDELVNIAIELLGRETLNNLKTMTPKERQTNLELLHKHGFAISEIARISGIGRTSIQKSLNNQR